MDPLDECIRDLCRKPMVARGLCGGHYQELRNFMKRRGVEFVPPHSTCQFDDCNRRARDEFCKGHLRQMREAGEMSSLVRQECPSCGTEVPKRSNGHKAYCEQCVEHRRARRHGLSVERYMEMLAEQDSSCAICHTAGVTLHIDHDHDCCPQTYSCGKCVRGLICGNCNTALGLFREDMVTLVMATAYLQRYAQQTP